MNKIKINYVCQNCGANSVKWQGKCPGCGEWNTMIEEIVPVKKQGLAAKNSITSKNLDSLADFGADKPERIQLVDKEINRVTGGGLVPGSVLLIGGEPGIGKSTLLLQMSVNQNNKKILYISGEESLDQIKLRAERIGKKNPNCFLLCETNLENILQTINDISPDIVIIDSIQTLSTSYLDSTAGSVPQIRECAARLSSEAKSNRITIFLVGHITKEGYIAGPKILEHMVDTVLYFEGDRNYDFRILRTIKNRFGSVSDIGIYEMNETGLNIVLNPSDILLSQRDIEISGIAISATIEGIRPMLIEIQSLVTPTYYGTPQRNTTGFDNRRLSMLLAVLEKRCGLKLNSQDVFLNIAGGIRVEEPSIDLAAIAAISSSYYDLPVKNTYCFAGEVGLSGEIRPLRYLDKRISEAEKLGFKKIYISSYNKNLGKNSKNIEIAPIDTVRKLMHQLFK